MPNRDFIDGDLLKPRDAGGQIRLGPAADASAPAAGAGGVGDLELPLIARHKKQVEAEAAQKAQEIERLRQLQENLEREKRELEEIRRKQTDYEHGKKEMLERLQQSLVALERHELRAAQLADLLQNARKRFKEMEGQLLAIKEDDWPEASVREELVKALALVEDARMEYNRTMARIEALMGDQSKGGATPAVVFESGATRAPTERTFVQWMLIGLAASLPLIIALAILAAIWLLRTF